jgi:hypothetical protein
MLTTQLYPTPALQLPNAGVANRLASPAVTLPALQPDRAEFGVAHRQSKKADATDSTRLTQLNAALPSLVHGPIEPSLVKSIMDLRLNMRQQLALDRITNDRTRTLISQLIQVINKNEKSRERQTPTELAEAFNTQHGLVKKN